MCQLFRVFSFCEVQYFGVACIVTSLYFATFPRHTYHKLAPDSPTLLQEPRAFYLNIYRIHLVRRRGNDVSSLWCETCNRNMSMSLYQHPLSSKMDVQHCWLFLLGSPLLVPVYSRSCVALLQPCGRAGHPCLNFGLPHQGHRLKHYKTKCIFNASDRNRTCMQPAIFSVAALITELQKWAQA